ncbi:MAG: cyclic nucleotide-binding domain-containing protein [Planctomycetes bacterium]|nr:cyclic nucleotide-binding domain-containing protein [Planctomycetota bacterium]
MALPAKATIKQETKLKQQVLTLESGKVLFEEGATSTEVYLMVKGCVVVSKTIEGESRELAVISDPNTYFGEMAALLGEPRSATITVKEPSQFIVVPGEKLEQLLDVSREIGKKLLKTLAARLAETNKMAVAANNQLKLVKQKFSAEYNVAIKDYKRLMMVIGLIYNDTKYPQLAELLEFSKSNSILSKMGIKTSLTPDNLKMYSFLSKAYAKNPVV